MYYCSIPVKGLFPYSSKTSSSSVSVFFTGIILIYVVLLINYLFEEGFSFWTFSFFEDCLSFKKLGAFPWLGFISLSTLHSSINSSLFIFSSIYYCLYSKVDDFSLLFSFMISSLDWFSIFSWLSTFSDTFYEPTVFSLFIRFLTSLV